MRFFGFFLGICEANAFGSFRVFAKDGEISHSSFKDTLAWTLLSHCEELARGPDATESISNDQRVLRSCVTHLYVIMKGKDGKKRIILGCTSCYRSGLCGTRVEKSCSCDLHTPMCKSCYIAHLQNVWTRQQ